MLADEALTALEAKTAELARADAALEGKSADVDRLSVELKNQNDCVSKLVAEVQSPAQSALFQHKLRIFDCLSPLHNSTSIQVDCFMDAGPIDMAC